MSNTEQFDFGFEPAQDATQSSVATKAKKAVPPSTALSPEAMAVALDAHPD